MELNDGRSRGATSTSVLHVLGSLGLCAFLLLGSSGCQKEPTQRQPSPPDLSGCTRITIEYLPSALEYFFPGKDSHKHLSPEELQYLQSLGVHAVDDQEVIKGFAHDVTRSRYDGPAEHSLGIANGISVYCYRDNEEVAAFFMIGGLIQTRDEHQFEFKAERTNWRAMRPPIWNLQQRVSCAYKIDSLGFKLKKVQDGKGYLAPEEWCDAIVERYQTRESRREYVAGFFKCPSKQEGKCNYAVNPNCKRDSPGDMVLLFETKASWNQHGGPELFTFDNHDPRGGCVVLNDRTVKFIRTEEELKQLRWE